MVDFVGFDEDKKKKIVCGNCAAILRYTNNEVQKENGTDYAGGPDGREWVNCPNCGKRAIIRSW